MKKILLVYHALSSGEFSYAGMEKMMVWLGNSLANKGFDITFCTFYDTSRCNGYSDKVKSIELGLTYSNSFIKRNFYTFIYGTKKLRSLYKKGDYDYVISFGDTIFFNILLIKLFYKINLITSERGDPYHSANFLERLRRMLLKYSEVIVFQTNGARDFFPESIKRKSIIISNPVTIPKEQWNQFNARERIVFVGRIDFWQKRPDLLLKAFAIVHKKFKNYLLDICGSGSEIERLKNLADELNISDFVVFHGAVNNVNDFLLGAEIFVLTSDFEGIPNALLEAMAIGMPVVSTDCSPGGAAMLIDSGNNGLLVPKGNINSIAEAICYLIDNKKIASSMAIQARETMKQYSPASIINKWIDIIK